MLAALTTLEQAVGRSGRAKEKRRPTCGVRRARDFLLVFAARDPAPEFRVAVGLASCATRPALTRREPRRTMRQILLPVDPPAQRNEPAAAGVARRPGRAGVRVAAAAAGARRRAGLAVPTAADERDPQQKFRGVPTFRLGVRVPAADLHALARGALDEAPSTCGCGHASR